MDNLPLGVNRRGAMAALSDARPQAIHAYVRDAGVPVSRDQVAQALGIPRSTAAFHLDRLVEAEVLSAENRRLSGRTGPGAGRPAKLYAAASTEILASTPERHYELAGDILAEAATASDREAIPMGEALPRAAHATGTRIGMAGATLATALSACGYDPREEPGGEVNLVNCPFHRLAARHTELICAANLALVRGIVEGCRDERTPVLAPRAGYCCVRVLAASDPAPDEGMSAETNDQSP